MSLAVQAKWGKLFIAENYPEAVGIMTALRKGGGVVVCEAAFGRDEGLV